MNPVTPGDVAVALARAAALGDFFAVTPPPRSGEWLPFTALLEPGARIGSVRSALATMARAEEASIDWRVAASTVSLSVVARLIAPPFGVLVATGVMVEATPESLWWQPVSGGPMPLSLDPVGGVRGGAADFGRVVLAGLVAPVIEAFRAEGVSSVVLVGNVASALGGAARMIATVRPDLADRAWSLTAELLTMPMLDGTATIGPMGLRRRSCCLYYRVPGGGYCGDCILADRGTFSR